MDLSVTSESSLGTTYLTRTGASGAPIVFASLKTFDYSPVEKVTTDTAVASVVQSFNFGSNGQPIEIEIKWCPAALYALLKQAREEDTTTPFAVSLVLKYAPSGTETDLDLTACTWLNLTYDKSKTGRSYRVFRDVVCSLKSVA